MGYQAKRNSLTKEDKDEYASFVGKRVIVNSYCVHNQIGTVTQHLRSSNHFWILLDTPYKTLSGLTSKKHRCNCGNVRLLAL